MKGDLKTKLFSSVIFRKEPDPVYFGGSAKRRMSLGGIVWTALAVAAAAGLLMLLIQKIKPFL